MVSRRVIRVFAIGIVTIVIAGSVVALFGGLLGGIDGGIGQTGEFKGNTAAGAESSTTDISIDRPKEQAAQIEHGATSTERLSKVGGRQRITRVNLHLRVSRFPTARQRLATATRDHGGFVSEVSRERHRDHNTTWTTGRMVLRVPAENRSSLRKMVNNQGIVLSEAVSTRDVTEQLIDLDARLANLKAQRNRLRRLYNRTNTTADLLEIQSQLSDVQGRIERLKARQESLQSQVRYTTLTVRLEEPHPGSDRVTAPYHQRSPVQAFLASTEGAVVLLRAGLVTLAYGLPYLAISAIAAAPVWWMWRHRG